MEEGSDIATFQKIPSFLTLVIFYWEQAGPEHDQALTN